MKSEAWWERSRAGTLLLGCLCACSGAAAVKRPVAPHVAMSPAVPPAFANVQPGAEPQQAEPAGLKVLADEVGRAMTALRARGELAPYFIAQSVSDMDVSRIAASNGGLSGSNRARVRAVMTDVRVGSHELDSTHPIGDEAGFGSFSMVPLDSAAHDALKRLAWREIDTEYQRASEQFLAVKSQTNVRVNIEDRSGDFSREDPVRHIGAPAPALEVDTANWERRVRELSAKMRDGTGIHYAVAELESYSTTRWLVNSEGTRIQTGERRYRLALHAATRADDGMELTRQEDFFATSAGGLPAEAELSAAAARVAADLAALRIAKPAEPFVGPAILAGRAAGVFFHETLGHRVEGERQKHEEEGQTFAKQLGQRVMPSFLNVYDDPRLAHLGSVELNGFYRFDDEGVAASRASIVEAGVLKGFLMSRVPVRGFVRSNGHGRRTSGQATARQANLVVEPSQVVSTPELRRLLIEEAKRQRKPYGLLFTEIEGGYTETVRESTQGYKLMPVMVYRVFTDGRPDELMRGVDIVGTPLISLTKVIAADNDYAVFNGSCGAESGWVPVSVVSPSLLVQQIEVALRDKGDEKPPLLPPPEVKGKP